MTIELYSIFLYSTLSSVVVGLGMYILGRYIIPKMLQDSIDTQGETLITLSKWTYRLVINAKNIMSTSTGAEKKEYVSDEIKELCKKWHVKLTDAQISALIEHAYDEMKSRH